MHGCVRTVFYNLCDQPLDFAQAHLIAINHLVMPQGFTQPCIIYDTQILLCFLTSQQNREHMLFSNHSKLCLFCIYHRTGFNCENLIASFSRVRKLLIRKLILLIAHPYMQSRIIYYVYVIHYPWCNLRRCNYLICIVAKRRQTQ